MASFKTIPFIPIVAISLLLSLKTVSATSQYQYWFNFLGPHNVARAALGLRPLRWDPQVAAYAQWYANQRSGDCQLRHSNGPYGENLFWGSGKGWHPEEAVAAWVAEQPNYNYYTNSCNGMCGHYTQIVWRDSRRLGCAMVICDDNKGTFAICSYDPPGNYVGMRPY